MHQTFNPVVSPERVESPTFIDPLAAMSFARLLAARIREVLSDDENRRAADAWKREHIVESLKGGCKNGETD